MLDRFKSVGVFLFLNLKMYAQAVQLNSLSGLQQKSPPPPASTLMQSNVSSWQGVVVQTHLSGLIDKALPNFCCGMVSFTTSFFYSSRLSQRYSYSAFFISMFFTKWI